MSRRAVLAGLCLALLLWACGDSNDPGSQVSVESTASSPELSSVETVDSGSWYVHEQWPHDGHPIETEHFVVYSDAASPQARQELGDAAEIAWAELLADLAVAPEMLHFPPGREMIDIYAYHDRFPRDWSGRAYFGGLLIWSPITPCDNSTPMGMSRH